MDSKDVSSRIKRLIWPMLQKAGFTVFSTRSAWRHLDDRVEVVNFQAVGAKFAAIEGCTPFSFVVNLGCHLTAIPAPGKVKQKTGLPIPEEAQCFFRRQLKKTGRQIGLFRRADRDDIWFVDLLGNNLDALLEEARLVIECEGFAWFGELPALDGALAILLGEQPAPHGTWGLWGRSPSPARHRLTGLVALVLGRYALAAEHLQKAIESGIYSSHKEVHAALAEARSRQ